MYPRADRNRAARRAAGCWALSTALAVLPLAAQTSEPDPLAELRAEIAALRRDYEARLGALERRLAELETAGEAPAAEAPSAAGDLERLRAAAREAAGLGAPAPPPPAPAGPPATPGRGRLNLNRLNPEISFTANVLGVASGDEREDFSNQEVELDLQAALDPFSRMRFTLALGEEGEVEIEEVWVQYSSLPGGLGLRAGRFRQTFGALNRQHLHALPQTEFPLALATYFGEEGLVQTGISLEWLLPRPWATANEISLQVTDGESEAFGGEDFENLSVLAHLKNYWDLSPAAYFEWGLSGAAGDDGRGGDSRLWGSDFTFHWQPPERAKYREVTWRTEALLSQRDDPLGLRREAWGGYSYLEGLVMRNLYLGVRYDRVEDPFDPSRVLTGFVPYLTWWQSEFVRLRAEYQRFADRLADDTESRFVLQLTWAAGPHKHETY